MSAPGTNTAFLETVTPEGIAIVTLDHFPVNSLSGAVTNGLTRAILEIERRGDEIKGVVLRGAGRAFCAGADISQFGASGGEERVSLGRPSSDNFGFEELPVPVVAAIHGYALGGGFELSLGCHYRVIAQSGKVGLPEVNIGLLPGAQGTQRLPRLIGSANALELMLSGDHVPSEQALAFGVVDDVVPDGEDLVAHAVRFCIAKAGQPTPRISVLPPPAPTDFAAWGAKMAKKRSGEPAPHAIIRCVQGACAGPAFRDGVRVEAREFGPLVKSKESAALRHIFFAERGGAKVAGLKAKPVQIKCVGIVGAGLMGGGIAMCCVNVGIKVVILDANKAGLEKGLALIDTNYARSVKRGSRSAETVRAARALLTGTLEYTDLAECDLVVEAVFEDLEVKLAIFKELDAVCKPSAFLCSNTSALDVDLIADATNRPSQVMGTHFFSPANVMKLLENVRGAATSDVTVASMMAWGKKIGKWVILAGNCPGFVGNRMVGLYGGQARVMLEEGAVPSQVDDAARSFGMRMGPLAMSDLVGLDLGLGAAKKAGLFLPRTNMQHALVESGRKGQKTKAGWFDYDDNRRMLPSPDVERMIVEMSARKGVERRLLSEGEIQDRLFFPLINEGFKILEEGYAQRPADIDVCYVHGYNFPRYRGGPMHHADAVGLPSVLATLEAIGIKPAKLLTDCVAAGVSLQKYWAAHGAEIQAKSGQPQRRKDARSRM